MRFVLAVGTTRTATIDGISVAGSDPDAMVHTPAADAELLAYGRPVRAPSVPVSPSGTVTPAMVTRAVRELVGFELLVLDAGLAVPTWAPRLTVGTEPGADIREPTAVPDARSVYETACEIATAVPDEEVMIAESIPGGTTTALGVLRALDEPFGVSSSLPENPVELKRNVVKRGLDRSGLPAGDASGDPMAAVRAMGDPVLAAVAGFVEGAVRSGTAVTLAGGTQLVATAALVRHAGVEEPLTLATTSFIADDGLATLHEAARALGLEPVITDPELEGIDHPALAGYRDGEVKEGVGMGGALHLAAEAETSMSDIRRRTIERYESVVSNDGS